MNQEKGSERVKFKVYQLPHAYFLLVIKQDYQLIDQWGETRRNVVSSLGKRWQLDW